jgi:hypothetical protein
MQIMGSLPFASWPKSSNLELSPIEKLMIKVLSTLVFFRSEIDCAAKCKNLKGCTAFRHILESQACQLGSLSNLVKASETDPDVLKIYIFGVTEGI